VGFPLPELQKAIGKKYREKQYTQTPDEFRGYVGLVIIIEKDGITDLGELSPDLTATYLKPSSNEITTMNETLRVKISTTDRASFEINAELWIT
jgi:hypothetical protein